MPEINRECYPEVVTDESLPEVVICADEKLPEVVVTQSSSSQAGAIVHGYDTGREPQPLAERDVATVTPLHLLGDGPDMIDCPFCERRTQSQVKTKPSSATQ